jgi:hypothetical protein
MLDPVSSVTIIARVGFFLSRYNSYNFDKRKEDDSSVRKWIATNLESAKTLSMGIMEKSHRNSNRDLTHTLNQIINQIDMFKNDAYMAESGIKGSFFSSKSAASSTSLKKLIEYDALILEEINKAREALSSLQKAMAASEEGIEAAAVNIHGYLSTSHSKFRDRIKYIKGFGD